MRSAEKPLNRMDRLGDMGHFPVAVHLGATANVLLTLGVTWWVERWVNRRLIQGVEGALPSAVGRTGAFEGILSRFGFWMLVAPLFWVGLVLVVNLSPVVLLRLRMGPATRYPTLGAMRFFTDQHKFSSWVYLAASANMAFWVLLGWVVFSFRSSVGVLWGMLLLALVATLSPVGLRAVRGEFGRPAA